jgi:hypothetical protein
LLVRENRPHDLNGEIVQFRQLIFTEAVDVIVMNDILFNVLGKTHENVGVVIRKMIVFLGHCTVPCEQLDIEAPRQTRRDAPVKNAAFRPRIERKRLTYYPLPDQLVCRLEDGAERELANRHSHPYIGSSHR